MASESSDAATAETNGADTGKTTTREIIASWRPTHVSFMLLQVPTNLPLDKVHQS
jgi:hypothetical protein